MGFVSRVTRRSTRPARTRIPRWSVGAVLACAGGALLAAGIGSPGCRQPHPVATQAAGLRVEVTLPRGETPRRASVDVLFDRPMVALGAPDPTPERGRAYLEITPTPPGYFHWVGTRTLSYIVSGGLPAATVYHARVSRGLRALDGTELATDVAWEFTTPRPKWLASVPAAGDSLARPEDPIVLVFDAAVEPLAVARATILDGVSDWQASEPDSALVRQLDWRYRGIDRARMVRLQAHAPLQRARAYELRIAAGMPGREGTLGLESDVVVRFRTYGPPGFVAAGSGDDASLRLRFRTPVDPDSVKARLGLDPTPPRLQVWGYGSEVILGGDLGYGKTYRIVLRAGLPDLFGQRLPEKVMVEAVTGGRGPMLWLLPETAVLLPSAAREVVVSYSGSSPAEVRARRASVRGEIRGRRNAWGRNGPALNPSDVTWGLRQALPAPADRNQLDIRRFDIRSVLPSAGTGAVTVEATMNVRNALGREETWLSRSHLRWSDLGITYKFAAEVGLAWTTRLASGKPVPGAWLGIFDDEAKLLWSGRTDVSGLARLPGSRELRGERWQLHLVAAAGGDTAVSDLTGAWQLDAWRYGLPVDYGAPALEEKAFLFADRAMYRPGETVHLAGLVRRAGGSGLAPAEVESVTVLLRDVVRRPIATRRLALDSAGGFAADFPTRIGADVGGYFFEARLPVAGKKEDEQIGDCMVHVAEYRAPSFRTSVRFEVPRAFPGAALRARVQGAYYFGAPLAGALLDWSLVGEETEFEPVGFEGYAFDDRESRPRSAAQIASGASALGDSGTAGISVSLGHEPVAGPRQLTLEAVVRDASGDRVAGRASVLLNPASVYAGVALDEHFVAAGEKLGVKLVAVRADTGLAVTGVPLSVQLVRREWRSVRKLLVGGRVGLETAEVDSVLETREVVSEAQPLKLEWTPREPGAYRVVVRTRDAEGRESRAGTYFYASGPQPAAWRAEDSAKLEMTTDRDVYRPGDVARVLVTSQLRGARVVLSVEREGVLDARVVELKGGSQVFEVPIESRYLPNVFVGISQVEGELSRRSAPQLPPEARLPRFSAGYVQLWLDTSGQRLAVQVDPEKGEYAPGEQATVSLQVRDAGGRGVPAHLTVAVVDEAVLALRGTGVPDPFGFFYGPRGLQVRNGDTRLELSTGVTPGNLAALKGESGGDGGQAPGDYRSEFATTAYWNAAVIADVNGRATVHFPLPDNLTSFRVSVVAAAGSDQFGSGSANFHVTQPLTLEPALPRFAVEGDTLELAAIATNRTTTALLASVRIDTDLTLLDKPAVAVQIPAGASRRVRVRAVATRAGQISVRLRASSNVTSASDAVQVTLAVEPPFVERVAGSAGATDTTAFEQIQLPAGADPASASLAVSLAASAVAGADRAFAYVVQYPYGCVEQVSSRLLVLALYKELLAGGPKALADSLQLETKLASSVHDLERMVLPSGGFAFWPGGDVEAPPPLEAYAAFTLARARRAGAPVSPDIAESVRRALVRWYRRPPPSSQGDDDFARQPRGLALFAASELGPPERGGPVEPADLDALAARAALLTLDDRMFLALALQKWGLHADLVASVLAGARDRIDVTAAGAVARSFEESLWPAPFRTATRATALTLLLASRVQPADALVPRLASGLVGLRRGDHWGHTQDDALALLALGEFQQRVAGPKSRFEAVVRTPGTHEPLLTLDAAAAGPLAHVWRTVPAPDLELRGRDGAVRFDKTGQGTLFYETVLRWRENALDQPAQEGGYTLVRVVEPLYGKGPFRLGDLAVVTLQIVVPRDGWYLALRDALPGGLEIVHTEFEVESEQASRELERWKSRYPRFPVTHTEIRDRELRLFADEVPPGVYEYRYLARVRAVGSFAHRPATLEAMYAPELHASTASGRWRAR